MKSFEYKITDEIGIHARPAGLLVKEVKQFGSKVIVKKGDKSADASRLMALMGMGIKCGDVITVEVSGPDEEAVAGRIKEFFEGNL